MKNKILLFVIPVAVILFGCENAGYEKNMANDYDMAESSEVMKEDTYTVDATRNGDDQVASSVSLRNVKDQISEKKIIKNAFIREQVKNVDESTNRIKAELSEYAAFIANESRISKTYELKNTIQIKVPAKNFDNLVANLCKEGIFLDEKRITSRDVTEEFVDIQLRLKTKKTVLRRYQELLRDKASTVEEVLLAEGQILILQEEIEAKEGRLKYLHAQVSMSTINLEVYELVKSENFPIFEETFGSKALDGLGNGWSFLVGFVLVLINLWPLLLVIGLIIWKGGWLWRKIRRT